MSSREETNESGLQKRGLRIVNKWISFDSLAYVKNFDDDQIFLKEKNRGVHRT